MPDLLGPFDGSTGFLFSICGLMRPPHCEDDQPVDLALILRSQDGIEAVLIRAGSSNQLSLQDDIVTARNASDLVGRRVEDPLRQILVLHDP
jgi:hypothetical protein